jgi:hypothetical protein
MRRTKDIRQSELLSPQPRKKTERTADSDTARGDWTLLPINDPIAWIGTGCFETVLHFIVKVKKRVLRRRLTKGRVRRIGRTLGFTKSAFHKLGYSSLLYSKHRICSASLTFVLGGNTRAHSTEESLGAVFKMNSEHH